MRGNSRPRILWWGTLLAVVLFCVTWTIYSKHLIIIAKDIPTQCNLDRFVLGAALNDNDPCLVDFVKKKMLVAPRSPETVKTIAFSFKEVDINANIEKLKWVQMLVIDGAPKDAQFFFVETGANDGRFLSSTIRLETLFGWNGVLIEPVPKVFKKLLENRKVWAMNAALCVTPHPDYVDFVIKRDTALSKLEFKKTTNNKSTVRIPCVPLYTVLTALNVTVVDFLSLDIEGAELQVLKTVPFDKVTFKIIIVEYNTMPGKNQTGQLVEFLEPKGYRMVAQIYLPPLTEDCVFVHQSVYEKKESVIKYLNTI